LDRVGITCRGCDARLPIGLAKAGESPALWECVQCGARFAGLLLPSGERDNMSCVRLADVHFDVSQVPALPDVLREVVDELMRTGSSYQGVNQRVSVRVPQNLEVVVAPLNESFSPDGWAFPAIVQNISESGLAVIGTQSIDGQYVAIRIPHTSSTSIQFIGSVRRIQTLRGCFHELGVRFIHRLGNQPGA
jgi:hypothetical protein